MLLFINQRITNVYNDEGHLVNAVPGTYDATDTNPNQQRNITMSNDKISVLEMPKFSDFEKHKTNPSGGTNPVQEVKLFLHYRYGVIQGNAILRKLDGMTCVKLADEFAQGKIPVLESPEFADPVLSAPVAEDYLIEE